jgi:hypothetical protein
LTQYPYSRDYGKVVTNYISDGVADGTVDASVTWKLFYVDEEDSNRIYLIAADYIQGNYAPNSGKYSITQNDDYQLSFDEIFRDYNGSSDIVTTFNSIRDTILTKWHKWVNNYSTSTNTNIKAIAYMLDTSIWTPYVDSDYAEYAQGGPTIEQFAASYNQKFSEGSNGIIDYDYSSSSYGYSVGWKTTSDAVSYSEIISGLDTSNNLYVITKDNNGTQRATGMWLASPCEYDEGEDLLCVLGRGTLGYADYTNGGPGIRPIVSIKTGYTIQTSTDGTLTLIEE